MYLVDQRTHFYVVILSDYDFLTNIVKMSVLISVWWQFSLDISAWTPLILVELWQDSASTHSCTFSLIKTYLRHEILKYFMPSRRTVGEYSQQRCRKPWLHRKFWQGLVKEQEWSWNGTQSPTEILGWQGVQVMILWGAVGRESLPSL